MRAILKGAGIMFAEMMLSLLLISSVCAVGMAIVTMEYMEDVKACDASYMKYGVCMQIWVFLALCILRFQYPGADILLYLMPMVALLGGGIFILGALSVIKALEKARSAFACLAVGIQVCVVAFLTITSCLMP